MKKVYLAGIVLTLFACTSPHSLSTTNTGTVHFGKPTSGGGCSGDGICNINNSSSSDGTYMVPFVIACQQDGHILLSFNTSQGIQAGFIVPQENIYYLPLGFKFTNFPKCCANNMSISDSAATYSHKGDSSILVIAVKNP